MKNSFEVQKLYNISIALLRQLYSYNRIELKEAFNYETMNRQYREFELRNKYLDSVREDINNIMNNISLESEEE